MQRVNRQEYLKAKKRFYKHVEEKYNEVMFGMKPVGTGWSCLFKDFIVLTFLDNLNDEDYGMDEVSCLTNKITK
jgi:hypothetical protein